MSAHPDLVAGFTKGLISGTLPPGTTGPADEVDRRFAVYRNNVAHSLSQALAARFPVIRRLVGDAFFAAMAGVFATAHRPTSPVLAEWGGEFPEFLAKFPPVAGLPYLPDVARIELARGRAYHAADLPALPAQALAAAAHAPGDTMLHLHPSISLVVSAYPVATIWAANQPGQTPGPVDMARGETALILRKASFDVPVQAISPGDAAFVATCLAGATLLEAAVAAAQIIPNHDPLPLLRLLLGAGAIIDPKEM
jgi:hypothetical protein